MLDALDAVLHQLLATRVTLLRSGTPPTVADEQIGFRPPDAGWRTDVNGLSPNRAVNVYLVELRENRKLRSNERTRTVAGGVVSEEPAPVWVDCHYLITAWSPAEESAGRTQDEHELLGELLAVLTTAEPLVPRRVFAPGSLPSGFPAHLADIEFPLAVAPTEGFPRLAEFWTSMPGEIHPWKPAVLTVVTAPVKQIAFLAGPPVTTATAGVRTNGSEDTLVAIGGTLFTAPGGQRRPVAGIPVRIETPAGERVASGRSDAEGRFRLGCFAPGQYRLQAAASGFQPAARDVQVPSASGEYDLELS
jgi:hypothetical protein